MKLDLFKQKDDFFKALKTLFGDLNIPVNIIDENPIAPEEILTKTYKDNNEAFQIMDDVIAFGMVDDAAFSDNMSESLDNVKKSKKDYDGILIFGVTLKKRSNGLLPTRTQLAEITRAFNREYYYTPVVVVFRYEDYISIANAERIAYKQEWREGEKSGKVSLLRDIDVKRPHTGHLKILEELKITRSGKKGINNFDGLYKYWQEVFSVSILNKQFYKELSDWYFWAMREVYFPDAPLQANFGADGLLDPEVREHNAKNLIRLLTRILFVWFVKEKKLIPEELFDENYIKAELLKNFEPQKNTSHNHKTQGSMYYRAILQNLFFATLNQDMGKREFRKSGQHMNVTNLMRYKSYFKNPDTFIELVENVVPFMNGGLFECLDKPMEGVKGKRGGDVIKYIDGFSDRDDNPLMVPDYVFFGTEDHIDLSGDYGQGARRNNDVSVKGLIDILQSYKFTIAENTPIEQDIALDPELLGRVFENLLASYNPETKTTARKQTGSFYTPREIVNYMVDESLIAHLRNVTKASSFGTAQKQDVDVSKASSFGTTQKQDVDVTKASSFGTTQKQDVDVTKASSFGTTQKQDVDVTKASSFGTTQKQDVDVTKASRFGTVQKQDVDVSKASRFGTVQKQDAFDTFTFLNPNDEINIHEGKLPHWEQKNVWFFVTFRLADSIPKEKVEQIKKDRENWNKKHKNKNEYSKEEWKEYNRLFNERVETWMNAGYGCCLLKNEKNVKIVAEALRHFEGERYELDEWVIMPNHVHVLVKPLDEYKLSEITHSWKSYTANEINKTNNRKGQLWLHESYDHIVRNDRALEAIRNYIRQNPVKAGISIVPGASSSGVVPDTGNIRKQDAFDTLDNNLHQLLSYDDIQPFEDEETKEAILKAIDECKILDPACGSGAFPMGALQKMVHIIHKLDPQNERWKERQIEKAHAIDDSNIRDSLIDDIEEAFENNELDYGRKLYLIENCIYGVDIQPIAVQISKLRFFISLIVEQKVNKRKKNHGVRPLPNLETKFVAANTLIGLDKPDAQGNLFDSQDVKQLESKLKDVRHRLFSAKTPKTKRKLREEDKELREQIAHKLEESGWGNETARQLADWDPYDQNASSPFFDPEWMFDIADGFDVVIGNPPWGAKISKEDKVLFKEKYPKIDSSTPNSFAYFVGEALYHSSGIISYVLPDSILIKDFSKTRRWAKNGLFEISWYLNTGIPGEYKPFVYIEHDVCVLLINQKTNVEKCRIKKYLYDFKEKRQIIKDYTLRKDDFIYPEHEFTYNLKIENVEITQYSYLRELPVLESILQCHEGIHTGNSRDILFHKKEGEGNYKPLFYGGRAGDNISNYMSETSGWYVDYRKEIINKKNGSYASLRDERIFKYPKIYVTRTGNPIKAFYDVNTYASNNFFSVQFKDYSINKPENLKRILPLILSKFANYYIRTFAAPRLGNTFIETKIYHLLKIPYVSELIEYMPLNELCSSIIQCVKIGYDYKLLQQVSDSIIYNLYFPDHMKERGIDVLQYVEQDINEVMNNVPGASSSGTQKQDAFDTLIDSQKESVINQLHKRWSDPENEVVKRMGMFKEKSPDILKPILES